MRKLRNLIGLPVIVNRQKIGRLVQAELSGDLGRLKGVWVDCGLRGTRYISSEQLKLIGEMAVIADDRGKRRRCRSVFPCYRAISACGQRLGAIVGAQIPRVVYGAADPKMGAGGSLVNLLCLPGCFRPAVTTGVLEEECRALLQTFFRSLRERKKLLRESTRGEEFEL